MMGPEKINNNILIFLVDLPTFFGVGFEGLHSSASSTVRYGA